MAEAKASGSPGSVLPWDSEFFGFRIGRLESRRLTASTLHTALTWAVAERLRCAYFFADATCPQTLAHAHEGGFRFVDLRMELAVTLNGTEPHATAAEFRPATAVDLPAIESLSRIAHHDTRFFKDTGFPANRAAELYVEWMRRDFRTHRIFVVPDLRSGIAGYVSCQTEANSAIGRIGLIAVAETERRRGLGRDLVNGALQWFRDNACTEVRVVTQASNIPAQRVYQALGFRTSETSATFHHWFKTS